MPGMLTTEPLWHLVTAAMPGMLTTEPLGHLVTATMPGMLTTEPLWHLVTAAMPGMLTTEPLWHVVTAADQAYLIITDVFIYCTMVVTMSRDVDGKKMRSRSYFLPAWTENNINAPYSMLQC